MDENTHAELHTFIQRASKATYAGDGTEVTPWRTGFKELEYREDDWYYRDSYAGSLRSWGQEVVWHNDIPTWICSYGGGMEHTHMNETFARKTFSFLKKALLAKKSVIDFRPRGPKEFQEGNWKYECTVTGDITTFTGREYIRYNGVVVFTHYFHGGLIVPRQHNVTL